MTETPNSDMATVLAQLAKMTQMMEAQQLKLDALESNVNGTNSGDSTRTPLGVGATRQRGDESQPEDDLAAMEAGSDGNRPSLGQGTSSRSFQHGIRAEDLWKTNSALSKDPFKCSFKLEAAKDYIVWKFAMSRLLDKEGILSFALGTAAKPILSNTPSAEEVRLYYRWQEFNNACESAILSSIGKSQLGVLVSCRSASEMWRKLQNLYMHSSDVNVARLEDQLHALRWKKNSTVDSYIQELDSIADSLRECGREVEDSRLKMSLLRGLPDKLENIKHILLQIGPQPYQIVCEYLRSHVGLSFAGDTSKAYLGTSDNSNETKGKSKPKVKSSQGKSTKTSGVLTCSHCNKTGHTVETCFQKNPCPHCKKLPGHPTHKCPAKTETDEQPAKTMMVVLIEESTSKACAVSSDPSTDEWIIDSGATQHMSNNLTGFSKLGKQKVNSIVSQ